MMRSIAVALLLCFVAVPTAGAQSLFVSSDFTHEVHRYDPTTGAFLGNFVSAASGGLNQPHGILDRGTDVLVASFGTDSVLRYDRDTGAFLDSFISPASGIDDPVYMAVGPDSQLYISSQASDEILRFDRNTGALVDDFVTAGSGGLDGPSGFAFGQDGRLYVAGRYSFNVNAYDATTGAFIETIADAGDGLGANTFGLNFASNGDLYFISNGSLFQYDLDTAAILDSVAIGGFPIGLEPGPDGDLYVATSNNLTPIDVSDNSTGPAFLGAGGTISTLNFFHFSPLAALYGDYDGGGSIGPEDFTEWVSNFGSTTELAADGNRNGIIDGADYTIWRDLYDASLGAGGGAGDASTVVPEPGSLLLAVIGFASLVGLRRRFAQRS